MFKDVIETRASNYIKYKEKVKSLQKDLENESKRIDKCKSEILILTKQKEKEKNTIKRENLEKKI